MSEPRQMPGSGAMGSSLGNWEFDSQTNKNANCVPEKNRFKFVDDLSLGNYQSPQYWPIFTKC